MCKRCWTDQVHGIIRLCEWYHGSQGVVWVGNSILGVVWECAKGTMQVRDNVQRAVWVGSGVWGYLRGATWVGEENEDHMIGAVVQQQPIALKQPKLSEISFHQSHGSLSDFRHILHFSQFEIHWLKKNCCPTMHCFIQKKIMTMKYFSSTSTVYRFPAKIKSLLLGTLETQQHTTLHM